MAQLSRNFVQCKTGYIHNVKHSRNVKTDEQLCFIVTVHSAAVAGVFVIDQAQGVGQRPAGAVPPRDSLLAYRFIADLNRAEIAVVAAIAERLLGC